jgi:acetyl-CoA acetyltransferase
MANKVILAGVGMIPFVKPSVAEPYTLMGHTPTAPQLFGGAGVEYQQKYGTVAAVLVSQDFAKRHGLRADVAILGQAMTTDFGSTFDQRSLIKSVGYDMSETAARRAYEQAGVGPEDIDVCELHDCFTANELLTYEALGFTPQGTAEKFVWDGDNTYGGRIVTNPSGGLLSKGHPLGATGLAQCTELVEQLRGQCGARQVEGARLALQHNIGIGGACVVTLYGKA